VRSEIIVCDKRFDIDHPVVTYEDENGFSAYIPHRSDNIGEIFAFDPAPGLEKRATRYRARRLLGKTRTLSRLKQVVRQFVIHLDGCRDAKMCYSVLHNQRGLSVHFLVDCDGTIYQTLDLADCAFHAGGVNEISVGAELQNRGDAARSPNYYPEGRPTVTCRVHGQQFLAYDYTAAQYEAMIKLGRALTKILDLPLASPQGGSGELIWTVIEDPRRFQGWVGHYHVEIEKWDPGPWDFHRFFRGIGSRVTFPMTALPKENEKEDVARFEREGDRYFDNSEQDSNAHFPVGPLGESRLWHGGVHLVGKLSSPIYAPFRGQVVAARMGSPCPVGSCNFVLLKHRLFSGRAALAFYSLFFHVDLEEDNPMMGEIVPWVSRTRDRPVRRALEQGKIALLGEEVEAGELVAHVGEAGPAEDRSPQFHFEIFSATELGQKLDPGYWDLVDGGTTSRFCSDKGILERIDRPAAGKPRDGLLSRREIRDFFQFDAKREELRRMVVRHRSEWTGGDWEQELASAPDFASLPPAERQRLIAQQVTPTLWWNETVASHAGLPKDGVVFSYHPVGFILWWRALSRKTATVRAEGIEGAEKWEGKMASTQFTVDAESAKGMTDEEDYYSGESGKNLTLEDLVSGYHEE
jgi:N-acetylmuramoyl-L-alanine amidase